ncbi:thioredoxin-dependent thiol peroxidase [Mangrovibacillus cuniculi]|uniref:thioredoxin-dependent peroxiredoxin n=1 Tax=Mangrovibacillus cuniculi TaxID=2593652 RepID=A0A7S8C9E8_9BACI|nr:thioredoxin-dependent thiol peroxidase [Mangrovibacillus cuniculi]QPC45798.1 thioredoxin-dependent thiol peroxidase [Mangrovibacillus cuniculi]
MTLEGKKAPLFSLQGNNGETFSLGDYIGKKVIVLYFYPKDMTPGCTTQACDFRDQSAEFENVNAMIVGISPDPVARHEKFINKHGLPFELLADENHEVAEAYGVWQLKKNFGKEYMGIVRSTFVIGLDGVVLKEWTKVKVKGHVEEALDFVKSQQ